MGNITYAKEWLYFSFKNFNTAKFLFDAHHYEDIVGVELQQSIEKLLKAVVVNDNHKIPKTHDLIKLYYVIEGALSLEDESLVLLRIATDYYKDDRYPNPNYRLPSRNEIEQLLEFTENLIDKVCKILEIDSQELFAKIENEKG